MSNAGIQSAHRTPGVNIITRGEVKDTEFSHGDSFIVVEADKELVGTFTHN